MTPEQGQPAGNGPADRDPDNPDPADRGLPPQREELESLLSRLCECGLGATESARLEELVLGDPAARAFYVRYMHLHADIGRQLAAAKPPAGVLGFLGQALEAGLGTVVDARLLAAFGTVFVLGMVTAWALSVTAVSVPRDTVRPSAASPSAPTSRFAQHGSFSSAVGSLHGDQREQLATLVTTADCQWEGRLEPIDSGTRLSSGEIRLTSGCAEIAFDEGAKVLVEGPARFTALSNRSGFLHSGKVVVKVPHQQTQFTLLTSSLVTQTQDGEFGVRATEMARSEVHVFQGSAQVFTQRRGQLNETREFLSAGSAVLAEVDAAADLSSAALRPLEIDPGQFVRRLPVRTVRLPPELVSYWTFDELGGPAFDRKGWNHGFLQGVVRQPGLVGSGAVKFSAAPAEAVLVSGGDASLTFTTGITIEALFVTSWDGAAMTYSEIYRKDDDAHRVLLSLQHDDNSVNDFARPAGYVGPVLAFGLNVDEAYHELELPLDGRNDGPTLAQLADGRPHHVAACYDARAGSKRIYLDGELRAEYQYPPGALICSGGARPAVIGNQAAGSETFAGTLDEIAIYSSALPAETIQAHWQAVQAGRGYFETNETESSSFGGAGVSRQNAVVALTDRDCVWVAWGRSLSGR